MFGLLGRVRLQTATPGLAFAVTQPDDGDATPTIRTSHAPAITDMEPRVKVANALPTIQPLVIGGIVL
jgi:hypothetical protein